MNARNLKIETASNTLRAKQAAELAALQKKIADLAIVGQRVKTLIPVVKNK